MTRDYFSRRFWDVLTGAPEPALPPQYPLLASTVYYTVTILLVSLLYSASTAVLRRKHGAIRVYAGDGILAFATCACSLENAMIGYHYGPWAYAAVVFLLGMWFCCCTPLGINSSPLSNMQDITNTVLHKGSHREKGEARSVIGGGDPYRRFVLRTAVQIIGARLSYSYARCWWYMEFTNRHYYRYLTPICRTDLKLSITLGFMLEFSGTLILLALCAVLPKLVKSNFAVMIVSTAAGVALTMIGLPLTGAYMNPINASNQTFGCTGTTLLDHVIVYWVGPMLAASMVTCVMHYVAIRTAKISKTTANNSHKNGVTADHDDDDDDDDDDATNGTYRDTELRKRLKRYMAEKYTNRMNNT